MRLRLAGTETRADAHESMTFLAELKHHVGNHAARREIDELLDAVLRIEAQG